MECTSEHYLTLYDDLPHREVLCVVKEGNVSLPYFSLKVDHFLVSRIFHKT